MTSNRFVRRGVRLHGVLVAFMVIATWLVASDASAQRRGSRGIRDVGLTVFADPDYRGTSASFRNEIADLRDYGLNDRVTSMIIDGGQAWEVCQDVNFGGRCRTFSGSVSDLREAGWNDRISSLRPIGFNQGRFNQGRPNQGRRDSAWENRDSSARLGLLLFDRPNYRGESMNVSRAATNLGAVGDRARSVEILGGSWELCDRAQRNGLCVTISESVPDLRRLGFRNGVTVARPIENRRWW
jgi:hypothetical protein